MTVRIINADVMDGLRQLADESVHCVVTSPPYWGLRSYLPKDSPLKVLEIGSEPTLVEHIGKLVEVFREVRRVMRKDATLWLNYGDMWCSTDKWGGGGKNIGKHVVADDGSVPSWAVRTKKLKQAGLKPKDLCMAPHRLAIALQEDGWWVRSDIIWAKPNPMPEGVSDRPTKAHEYVFLLSKAARYHYDADAIRTPLAPKTFTTFGIETKPQGNDEEGNVKTANWHASVRTHAPKVKVPSGWDRGEGGHGTVHREGRGKPEYQEADLAGANARSVWMIATEAFPDAHYATFPTALVERCLLAGCPAGGTVLDPFGGSGTVGLVADRLQRHAILVDLNPDNKEMSERRINGDRGALLDIMEAAE